MVYTVTFNPALDYVMRVAHFEPGMTNRTSSEEIQLGGKGINVSCVLKALGIETTALGFVAGFTGRELERSLRERGIRQDFIRLDEGQTRINVKIKGSAETEINAQGPAVSAQALDELMRKLDALGEGDVLVISGSIPASMPDDSYEKLLRRVEGRGVFTVVDATRDLLCNVLGYHPFLIKPNHIELGEIFGRKLNSDTEILLCARPAHRPPSYRRRGGDPAAGGQGRRRVGVSCAPGQKAARGCPCYLWRRSASGGGAGGSARWQPAGTF